MKKVLLSIAIVLTMVCPAFPNEADDLGHLFAGSYLTEHLKRKDCDPFLSFLIVTGLSFAKELYDKDFSTRDLSFTVGGVFLTYGVDEIVNFIMSGIQQNSASSSEALREASL